MAGETNKRRSVRQAITRKRSIYLDPDTDDDFALAAAVESSDDGGDDAAGAVPEPAPKKSKLSGKRSGRPPQRETRSKAAKKAAASNHRPPLKQGKRKAKQSLHSTKLAPVAPVILSDEIIPKWQTLPYEILSQIFSYAFAAELEIEGGPPANRRINHPSTWLMRTSRKVCHEFTEPALTAFYQAPVLLSNRWLEDLLALVRQPEESLLFKYRMKVKRLEVSARHLESHQRENNFALADLVASLPQLNELVITHPQDEAPFEYRGRPLRWKYTPLLFDALDQANIRLNEWRWNWHLITDTITGQPWHESSLGDMLSDVHSRTSFQSLQHLTISHLPSVPPFPELIESQEDPAGDALGKAICKLPNLKSLAFETCDCLTEQLVQNLPENLQSLRIVNCATLTSDILYNFLSRGGSSNLKELILDHNPFLDLAFFTTLKSTCPRLEVLKMDLYDHRENHFNHFGEPKYEQLLVEDEIPTWPCTLRTIELVHMQKWGTGSAQNLFHSLVEAADSLPDLRRLVLHAHINISWRDRAAFRDQWIERLCRVYQRQDKTPDPRLASLKTWRLWKQSQQPKLVEPTNAQSPAVRERVLSHVAITPRKVASMDERDESSGSEARSKRRSKRISDQQTLQVPTPPHEPEVNVTERKGHRKRGRRDSDAISVVSNTEGDGVDGDWRSTPEKFIQGLCNVVDICIDNQRPRGEQYNESHFVDSELSGDEDWHEGADAEDNGYARQWGQW